MRPRLCHVTLLQNQDLVAVADSPQSMGNENASMPLFLQDTVDVLQERLFRVGVQCRSLHCSSVLSLVAALD